MKQKTKHLIELNFASFLLSINPIFAKLISLPAHLIIFWRSFFAMLVLGGFIFLSKQSIRLAAKKEYLYVLLCGLLLAAHWVTFFLSIKVATVAIGMIAIFTFPIMTVLIEPYFFKHKLKPVDLIMAGLVLLGVVFIVPEFSFNNTMTQGIFYGLLSALLYSFRNVFVKKTLSNYSGSVLMFYQVFVAFLVLSPFLLEGGFVFQGYDFYYLIVVGVIFTALAHSLFVRSLSNFKAKTASIITSIQPVYSILLAFFILSEVPEFRTVAGGLIILFAVLYESFKGMKNA